MLKKVPFLKESGSDVLLKRIALKLQVEIYLPQDYLIYKDDIGEEMYFIGIGSVNIISPDNSKIIKSLFQGDFFGEMALINNSKRMCSVVADTLCLVYSLQKKDFYEILQNLPEILAKLKKQSELRSRETTSVSHSGFFPGSEEEEQRKLFNHLKMYSLVSSYYNDYSKTRENSSLLAGMKNIKSATAIESFAKDRSGFKIYKRRPGTRGDGERRNSQTSLGKKLVFDRFSRLKMRWTAGEEVKS
jgi:CRP-like cAMP-binding protein